MRNVRHREVTKSHITQISRVWNEPWWSVSRPSFSATIQYCLNTNLDKSLKVLLSLYHYSAIEVQCLGIIPSQMMIVWPCTSDFINYFHFFICFSVIRMKCIYKTYRMNVSYKHCVTTFFIWVSFSSVQFYLNLQFFMFLPWHLFLWFLICDTNIKVFGCLSPP